MISRHSDRQADLPQGWKRSIRRLHLVWANTGSILAITLVVPSSRLLVAWTRSAWTLQADGVQATTAPSPTASA